jgi:glycosyltransferase involved in cell wall biosynthesis
MSGARRADRHVRLGVVVPARDEASTIQAKLADLAACEWPLAGDGRAHVIVVVDDHSSDGTAELAQAYTAASSPTRQRLSAIGAEVHVIASRDTPGKPGAIRAGLTRLRALGFAADDDIVLLTDADVGFEPGALVHVAAAFTSDPRLGMATGAQAYVAAAVGEQRDAGRRSGTAASDMRPYDRLFGFVRRCESRFGALLSVHGQLLAWRMSMALAPPDGRAADDLELVVAARDRSRPPRVRLLPGARFIERRAHGPEAEHAQALRRARAWFQHFGGPAPRRPALALQWRVWALAPLVFSVLGAPLAPFSRGIARRRRVLAAARRSERAAPLSARWEVVRG